MPFGDCSRYFGRLEAMRHSFGSRRAYLVVVSLLTLVGACSTTPPAHPTVVVPMEVLNPDVRPETIDQTICVAGYTAPVHPATSRINRGAPK